jgi:hypothetical protein
VAVSAPLSALGEIFILTCGNRDVVDTTPSTGNVWKMLLGAINATYDGDFMEDLDESKRFSNTSSSTAMTSPLSQHRIDEN